MIAGDRVTTTPGVAGTVTEVLDRQRVTVAWDDGLTTDIRNDQLRPEAAYTLNVYQQEDGYTYAAAAPTFRGDLLIGTTRAPTAPPPVAIPGPLISADDLCICSQESFPHLWDYGACPADRGRPETHVYR